jgi:hypothetical protein
MAEPLVTMPVSWLNELGETDCPQCDETLLLYQPDTDRPGRLLGACEECGHWFLIDAEADAIVQLPGAEQLRSALAEAGESHIRPS